MIDWRTMLADYLVRAGTIGRRQADITKKMQNHVNATEVLNELEALQAAGKVDKYQLPTDSGRGRKTVQWRATTKLLES